MAIETRIFENKTVFGDWKVEKFIGSGSGGRTAVFRIVRAHDGWEETAALKVVNILEEVGMKIKLAEDYQREYNAEREELCRQAEEELRLMSRLKGNPNIVEYYDFQFADYQEENVFGTDLLIRMELLKSLSEERREKTEYSEEETVKIGKDICRGLSFCHKAGIIHRDIKPANIFVTEWGHYKLGDFGIARMVDAGQKASTKMGTKAYAAPEQFMSNQDKYDSRVDIYSLGLTLYELTNHNRLPFAATGYVRENEIQQRITGKEMPEPENANPALAAVIKKACAYRPEARYASVEELEEALMAAELGVSSKYVVKKSVERTEQEAASAPVKDKPEKKEEKEEKSDGYIILAVVGVLVTVLVALILTLAFNADNKKGENTKKTEMTVTPNGNEVFTFENLEVDCGGWGNSETGDGYNMQGEPVNWCLWIEFDLTQKMRIRYQPKATASWGHIKNGEGRWEGEANFTSAKEGTTFSEIGTWEAENSPNGKERFSYMILLPDDPSIEGEQSVIIQVGEVKKKISFELIYDGDYETGRGWSITDVRYEDTE